MMGRGSLYFALLAFVSAFTISNTKVESEDMVDTISIKKREFKKRRRVEKHLLT